jgi:hypothetical protein
MIPPTDAIEFLSSMHPLALSSAPNNKQQEHFTGALWDRSIIFLEKSF